MAAICGISTCRLTIAWKKMGCSLRTSWQKSLSVQILKQDEKARLCPLCRKQLPYLRTKKYPPNYALLEVLFATGVALSYNHDHKPGNSNYNFAALLLHVYLHSRSEGSMVAKFVHAVKTVLVHSCTKA